MTKRDNEGRGRPVEIEITPEMLEAGVSVLNRCEDDNWMPDRGAVVRTIFRAMCLSDPALAAARPPEAL